MEKAVFYEGDIRDKIHIIRGLHVMLDEDLAELYGVETKILNQAVKRNIDRFPNNFMFQLSESEAKSLRSQLVTLNKGRGAHRKYSPYAFTEQGVAMLSGVLKSNIAVKISIQIINAFVDIRRFIASNGQIFHRIDVLERKSIEYDKKFEEVFEAIQGDKIPEKGIFFDGQVFDAYKFLADLIRSACSSIILIDNYVDESVLLLLSKRRKGVNITIYTTNISKQLRLDVEKYNAQYPHVELRKFSSSHDRFMIIDENVVYHFGASLKDLGRKWFGFSKFSKDAIKMLERLEDNL
ncbi:MAG: ORF6N domain-containing protein [Candidatus Woesearchaeota archaeon]